MYRRRNGSLSFSFTRFVTNAVPVFASSTAGYIELTPQLQDSLYSYQLATGTPLILGPTVFYVAGCTDHERKSRQIHRALEKNGVLDAAGRVDTTKIGPKFIHQLAFVDQMSQKNLINVLFFWEEECHRLNKLQSEEEELSAMIEQAEKEREAEERTPAESEQLDQMRFARERVRMKKRQRPSQRRADVEMDQDTTVQDAFKARVNAPPYGGPGREEGQAAQGQQGLQQREQEMPPSYYAPQGGGRHWSVA